jgi:hypothetical protein
MRQAKSIWVIIFFLAGVSSLSNAEIFSVPLNCAGTYVGPGPSYYQYEFDLGQQLYQINSVSIAWSGQFSASVVTFDSRLGTSDVVDTQGKASMGKSDAWAIVSGGLLTYPNLETFNCTTCFLLNYGRTWDDLLDGKSKILIEQSYYYFTDWGGYLERGSWYLNDATLYIDAVLPEPATLLLLGLGGLLIRRKN